MEESYGVVCVPQRILCMHGVDLLFHSFSFELGINKNICHSIDSLTEIGRRQRNRQGRAEFAGIRVGLAPSVMYEIEEGMTPWEVTRTLKQHVLCEMR